MRNSAFDPAVRVALAWGNLARPAVASCFGKTQKPDVSNLRWGYSIRKNPPCQEKRNSALRGIRRQFLSRCGRVCPFMIGYLCSNLATERGRWQWPKNHRIFRRCRRNSWPAGNCSPPWGTRPGRNCCVPCWQAPAREAVGGTGGENPPLPPGGLPPPADSQGGGHCPGPAEGTYIYYYLNPQDGEIQRVLRLFQSIQQVMASAPEREGEP